jgi:hypothetical protein
MIFWGSCQILKESWCVYDFGAAERWKNRLYLSSQVLALNNWTLFNRLWRLKCLASRPIPGRWSSVVFVDLHNGELGQETQSGGACLSLFIEKLFSRPLPPPHLPICLRNCPPLLFESMTGQYFVESCRTGNSGIRNLQEKHPENRQRHKLHHTMSKIAIWDESWGERKLEKLDSTVHIEHLRPNARDNRGLWHSWQRYTSLSIPQLNCNYCISQDFATREFVWYIAEFCCNLLRYSRYKRL